MLAPIVVFTFKRLDALKQLLHSLEENAEIMESDLYFFSDLNEKKEDEEQVIAVRSFLDEYKREKSKLYKSITIIQAEVHKGLADSIITGVSDIIDRYGEVIVLEDDLLLSRYFLLYMNQCLQYYKKNQKIWSVSGYSATIHAKEKYKKTVYLDYRAMSWGWATWEDRWRRINWDIPDYSRFRRNPISIAKLCRGGNDLPSMLREQANGKIDSWAVRWVYHQSMYNMYSVAPTKTLVINTGFGADATNCDGDTKEKYGGEILSQEECDWRYDDLSIDCRMAWGMYKKHSLSFHEMIKGKIDKKHKGK